MTYFIAYTTNNGIGRATMTLGKRVTTDKHLTGIERYLMADLALEGKTVEWLTITNLIVLEE